MKTLDEYYNKFNEDKRLDTRRGQVEFKTTMKYIYDYIKPNDKVLEIGAGTGKYSLSLANDNYDVTAIELVLHNLKVITKKNPLIKAYQGNALNLNRFKDNTFDLTLLLGPMYHLKTIEEQVIALNEAKRVTKNNGIIMVAYCMNEYALITHGFKKHNIINNINNKEIDPNYHITNKGNELYNYVRIEDIDKLNKTCNLKRIKLITPDGCASYIKDDLNKMSNDEFNIFLDYHFKTCERTDLLGSATHTLDILRK